MTDPNIEGLKKIEITEALKAQMLAAGTAEKLTACWQNLYQEANLEKHPGYAGTINSPDALAILLRQTHQCFVGSDRFACDIPVKRLWEIEAAMTELDQSGIPREFLLQTVRVGALKELLASMSGPGRHDPHNLHTDGTINRQKREATDRGEHVGYAGNDHADPAGSLNLDGYAWANRELGKIKSEKIAAAQAANELAAQQLATRKATTIQEMATNMRTPGYELTQEQKDMLHHHFRSKLWFLKAIFEQAEGRHVLNKFRKENGNKTLDQALFEELSNSLSSENAFSKYADRLSGSDGALQILNPQSGWHYVILKNGVTTFNDFYLRVCSNMGDSFDL